eukprot:10622094-Alexandrium_andersonii.AAC.1
MWGRTRARRNGVCPGARSGHRRPRERTSVHNAAALAQQFVQGSDSAASGDLWFRRALAASLLQGGGTLAYEHGFRACEVMTWPEDRSALDECSS